MKKNYQTLLCVLLALSLALFPVACGSPGAGSSQPTSDSSNDGSAPATESGLESEPAETDKNESVISGNTTKVNSSGSNATASSPSSASNPPSGSSTWKQVLAGMPKDLRGTQIEVFHWNPASELPGGSKLLSDFKNQTGMNVKWVVASYDNYDVELQARVAANNAPDVVLFQWMNANRMSLCQPVSNTGFQFNSKDWDSDLMNYYTVKGKTYAVNMKNTLLNRPAAIVYNRSLIEKYDFEDPYALWKKGKWTEKKFMDMCKEFKKQMKGPAWVVSKFDVWTLLVGLQCEMSYKDGKYGNNLRDPKAVIAWQKCANLAQDGLIDRSWDIAGFESGKYLFMDTSVMFTRATQPYFANMKSAGTLGVVPYFTVDGQSTYYQPMDEYEAYGIAKGAKNAKGAPYFLRYYLDPENYNEKTFFCNDNALDVYKFCMKQQNRIMHNRYPLGSGNSHSPIQEVRLSLEGATAAQVPTVLNTFMGKVDSCVADLNNKLNKLS